MPLKNIAPTPEGRLLVKRKKKGFITSVTKDIPKPIVIVDTREKDPFDFSGHMNWIAGTERIKLDTGDYSIKGMESILRIERKTLTDAITSLMQHRRRFISNCKALTKYRYRAILLEASYKDVKSYYDINLCTNAHPNAVSGSLDAIEARFQVPIIYTSRHRELAEEKIASWLSKHFTYWYLEKSGAGRYLIPGDL